MITAMKHLLQISPKDWLFSCAAAAIAAFVLILVAEVIGALFILLAFFALLFAAAAFIKGLFFGNQTPEKTDGEAE